MKSSFFLILLMSKCIFGMWRLDPLVATSVGLIKGLQADDGDYSMFMGIPYALVDEDNPFSDASPHPRFTETFDAYHDGTICPQYTNNNAIGIIQCLQLNIYVPNSASSANTLPVMVYIHGGSFVRGHKGKSDLSPKFLIKHDVIIVTVNYRLGPYGFLCLSEPGFNNQGLKDQFLALKWVKDNIAAFGGDAAMITAFGQSAGAMTLDLQLLVTENLVQRAIVQSGPVLSPWVIATENNSIAIKIAENLGYTGEDIKEAIQYLSKTDPIRVIQATEDLESQSSGIAHPITKPCIQTESIGDDKMFLKDFPVNLQPKVKDMDILIGHTNKEAMFLYPNSDKEFYKNYRFEEELYHDFQEVYDVDTVRHFYVGDEVLSEDLKSVILDYASDFAFAHPVERTVEKYLNAGARVYRYMFAYEGGRNRLKIMRNLTADGASHGDDLGYLFDSTLFENKTPSEDDQRIIDAMSVMWTNFAKYGNPTPSTTEATPVKWLPVGLLRRPFLKIDKNITLDSRPLHRRMAFWDLYYKLHADKIKGTHKINIIGSE